ncbi:UNVERIFIED_CONTAM: hypothetical protein FKN15_065577 [Acipenser sinensis]
MFKVTGIESHCEERSGGETFLRAMSDGKVYLARFILAALDESILNARMGESGTTLLVYSAGLPSRSERRQFVRLLLGRGAEVDGQDDQGRTALSHACERGHLDTVKLLVQHGADPGFPDSLGKSAAAYGAGRKDVAKFLSRVFSDRGLGANKGRARDGTSRLGKSDLEDPTLLLEESAIPDESDEHQGREIPGESSRKTRIRRGLPVSGFPGEAHVIRNPYARDGIPGGTVASPDGFGGSHREEDWIGSAGVRKAAPKHLLLTPRSVPVIQNPAIASLGSGTDSDQNRKRSGSVCLRENSKQNPTTEPIGRAGLIQKWFRRSQAQRHGGTDPVVVKPQADAIEIIPGLKPGPQEQPPRTVQDEEAQEGEGKSGRFWFLRSGLGSAGNLYQNQAVCDCVTSQPPSPQSSGMVLRNRCFLEEGICSLTEKLQIGSVYCNKRKSVPDSNSSPAPISPKTLPLVPGQPKATPPRLSVPGLCRRFSSPELKNLMAGEERETRKHTGRKVPQSETFINIRADHISGVKY